MRRRIHLLGALQLSCFAALSFLSHGMAPLLPFGTPRTEKLAWYRELGAALAPLGEGAEALLAGNSFLQDRTFLLASYCLPMLVATAVFVAVLALLHRGHDALEPSDARRLLNWGVAFAAAGAVASPVLTHDFWLSFGWGRMVAAGQNPYDGLVPFEFVRNLPKGPYVTTMTYGPLWALVSGSVMFVAQEKTVLGAILFKFILAAAWILALLLIDRLLRDETTWYRCAGIAIFGWLPLSSTQSVGEGHNDVFMVSLVLLWLYLLRQRRNVLASAALACSAAVKYVTLPLFILDVLQHVRSGRVSLRTYSWRFFVASAVIIAVFIPFFRFNGFFEPMVTMRTWHFYTPIEAVSTLAHLLGVRESFFSFPGMFFALLSICIRAFFLSAPFYFVVRYYRKAGWHEFYGAVLAIMSAILFLGVGHVWPWFVLWAIAPAALVPTFGLARWAVGVAIAAPFPILAWTAFPPEMGSGESAFWVIDTAGVLMYVAAVIWFMSSKRLFRAPSDRTDWYVHQRS
jgi:alpha-1,6-mannosyltransferase